LLLGLLLLGEDWPLGLPALGLGFGALGLLVEPSLSLPPDDGEELPEPFFTLEPGLRGSAGAVESLPSGTRFGVSPEDPESAQVDVDA
jgi:hypothetical protein